VVRHFYVSCEVPVFRDEFVRKMVQSYLENSQTIILAVLPSNVDIATQEMLEMAERADPEGARTIGVLTKPDLVTEAASQKVIEDLLLGKEKQLQLGYYVVKNRSTDDEETTVSDRLAQENAFFEQLTWREIAASGRCGIEPLKNRLSELITDIWRKRLPNVKSRVTDGSTGGLTRQRVSELLGAGKINPFHPWEEQRHPWSINKSQDLDCPLLRIWDSMSGSQPEGDGRMLARSPCQSLETEQDRCSSLTTHLDHR
jgi:hypothetical protein